MTVQCPTSRRRSLDDLELPLCFRRVVPFGAVRHSLSDLLGLRLSLPLQSRPAQISEGTPDSTDELEHPEITLRRSPLPLSH